MSKKKKKKKEVVIARYLGVICPKTRSMMMQSARSVEQLVREDLAAGTERETEREERLAAFNALFPLRDSHIRN